MLGVRLIVYVQTLSHVQYIRITRNFGGRWRFWQGRCGVQIECSDIKGIYD